MVLITALVLEYLVVPQFVGARAALTVLSGVSPGFLALGLGLELASLMSYSALTRCVLPAPNRPSYWTVLRVDISALGVSHLLPGGGATASALRYRLFTVAGMAPADVLSATAIEGFGAAVVLAMVFTAGLLSALPSAADNPYLLVTAGVSGVLTAAAGAAVVLLTRHQERTVRWVRAAASVVPRLDPDTAQRLVDSLASRLNALAGHPRLLAKTLIWASANWLFDAASLWCSCGRSGPRKACRTCS
ncbi:MAG TPA: lysylphosphatidylglycerol synthase domain-containing protein [Kineosporiaceae bacterium]|nr:lysylphosphatidylglycerol synthase domain-containing protein [Kineosporiaceae bacterium]